ncbi:MAG: HAMP domain-containing sensor histidine kinase [Rhodothermales bacterium]|nr:HAMP domain-containing sensor histidine kinase [Rhodothermales bacterium]
MIYQCALEAGMTEHLFFQGVGYTASTCPEWIGWDHCILFHNRIAAFAGSDDRLRTIGYDVFKAPSGILLLRVLGLFSDLSSILMRMNAFVMRTFFPGLQFETVIDKDARTATASIAIPEPFATCRAFFVLSASAYEATFRQLKVPYRAFSYEVSERSASYTFSFYPTRSFIERIRHIYHIIVGADFAVQQLAENEEELRRRLEIVEAARAEAESLRIKEAEARQIAVQALDVRQRFLAVMSHELRTPLNHIIGASTILKDEALSEENQEMVGIVDAAAHNLLHLIELVLDFTGVGELAFETASEHPVSTLIDPLADKTHYACEAKGLTFEYHPLASAPNILVYPGHLSRILTLLLDNAVKFTDEGSVRLEVEMPANKRLAVRIVDSGHGIPGEWGERVFEPFQALDDSQTRARGGIGLGLTIARKLAQEIGGDVRLIASSHEGTTFQVDVPIEPQAYPGDGMAG